MAIIVGSSSNQISSTLSAHGSADTGRTPTSHGQQTGISSTGGQVAASGGLTRTTPPRHPLVASGTRKARQLHDAARNASTTASTTGAIQEDELSSQGTETPARRPIVLPYTARPALMSSAHDSSGADPMGQSGESSASAGSNATLYGVIVGSAPNDDHSDRLGPADMHNLAHLLTPEEMDALSRLAPEDPERLEALFKVVQSVCDRLRNEADQAGNLSGDLGPLQMTMDEQRQANQRWMNEHSDSMREPAHPASGAPNRDALHPHVPDTEPPAGKPAEEAGSGPRVQGGRVDDKMDAHPKPEDYSELAKDFFKLFEGTNEIQKMFMEMMLGWIRMIAEFSKKLNDIAARAI